MADFHSQLQAFHAIRCDEAALRILGLSLAGWGFYEIVRWAEGRIAPWRAAAARR